MFSIGLDWIVVVGALAVAVLVVLLRLPRERSVLGDRMGQGSWDFTKSWASNLTGLGAFLTTILGAAIVPKGSPASTDPTKPLGPPVLLINDYVALSLFFALLVIIAAIIFNATMSPVEVDPGHGNKAKQPQGRVGWFLVATGVTLWAVIGQIVTVFQVFWVVQQQGAMSFVTLVIFWTVLLIALACLLVYAWNTIPWTIEEQASKAAHQRRRRDMYIRQKTLAVADEPPPVETALNPPIPPWSLL